MSAKAPACDTGAGDARNAENLRLLHLYLESPDAAVRAEALSALTERNMGLVHAVAGRYRDRLNAHTGIEYEDLVQIGIIGMLRAAQSFDFSFATTFSTYAVPLIVGEIRRCLRDDGTVHVSRDLRQRGYRLFRLREAFRQEHGRDPTADELANLSGEPCEMLVFLLDATTPVASLSEPMAGGGNHGEDGEDFTLAHVLCDEEDAFARLTEHMTLHAAIGKLCARDRAILRLRYGKALSQQQTAAVLGLSQVKISRTEKKIFAFLREEIGS